MRRCVAAVLLVAAGASLAPAAAAQDAERETGLGIRLLEAPTELRDDPRAQVYVVDHVAPGESFERRIEVVNDTERVVTPTLYVASAVIEDGGFVIGDRQGAGEIPRWATVQPDRLELGPRSRSEALLRVAVPPETADGEYYGAAVAEIVADVDGGVRLANRVGIRMYLSVGDGPAPTPDFEVRELVASRRDDGTAVVTAEVENVGARALDVGGDLTLDDGPGGARAGPFTVRQVPTLAVGATEPVVVELEDDLPAGPWLATLTLRSGEVERTVEATITFPEAGEAPRSAAFRELEEQKRSWGIVAGILLVLVLLALLLVLVREWRRRRRAVGVPPT